jgi:HlyD family secretion protein
MVAGQQKRQIFREQALEQANSPEQLDRLVQVTGPRRWLSLAAFGLLVSCGAAWSVVAKIPITVTGKGVLIYPSNVATVQSNTTGQLLSVKVKAGDPVKKGQIIAFIDQSELRQELQQAKAKLTDLQRQSQDAEFVRVQRERFAQTATDQQRATLQQSLQTVRSMTPILQDKGLASIQRERQALQQQLQTLRDTLPTYQQRWEARRQIGAEGAISKDQVLQAQQEYQNFQTQINQVETQLKQLDAKEAAAQQQTLENANQVNDLQAKLANLTAEKVKQSEQDFSADTNRQKEIQETQRTIAQLEGQLQRNSTILSPYDGKFLEVVAKPGQRIESGAGIGTVSVGDQPAQLVNIVFLEPAEGKKVTPGMAVQTTPTTVKREEYGGILGTVKDVSSLSVTQAGAASLVGHPDMLKGVMAEGSQIAISTHLNCAHHASLGSDCAQYEWSGSQGPPQKLTPGTTTTTRITIAERAPITYVLPFLKNLIGIKS